MTRFLTHVWYGAAIVLGLLFQAHADEDRGNTYTTIQDKATLPILTPSLSERQTLKIRLPNGLQALIISDPNADKSFGVLDVEAGSWEDPPQYPGIAHFLEHMLFLGTKAYPSESEYQNYITQHGGSTNAFTSNDYTSFLFSIDNKFIDGALDRFSEFFKEPLFNPSGVARELHAIDQEYSKNIQDDNWREIQVMKELNNESHPNHQFSMGNSQTLSKVSQETLKQWYKEHYSANLMHLVVSSSLPLDKLKDLVVKDFSGIPNYNLPRPAIQSPLSSGKLKEKIVYIEPVKHTQTLSVVWYLPEEFAEMKNSRPDTLVCHILGHEGTKSLLAELKHEKLAESLSCGGTRLGKHELVLYVEIELTEQGTKNVYHVLSKLFHVLTTLRGTNIPHSHFEEVNRMGIIDYQYQPREEAFESAMKHAMMMVNEDLDTYPEKSLIVQEYNSEDIQKLLNFLTPGHSEIFLMAPSSLTGIPSDHKEQWLGVEYAIKDIPTAVWSEWHQPLSKGQKSYLPMPNPFIPQKLSLVNPTLEQEKGLPLVPVMQPIWNDENAKVFFAIDARYRVPELYLYLQIKTPEIFEGDPVKVVMGDLLVKILNEKLNKFAYPANMAGLNYKIERIFNGVSIQLDGYSENASVLFGEIIKELKALSIDEASYNLYKNWVGRDYRNSEKEMPYEQALETLKALLYRWYSTPKQKEQAIENLTYVQFQEFLKTVFEKTFVDGVVYGNLLEETARNFVGELVKGLDGQPFPKGERVEQRAYQLPDDQGPFYFEERLTVQGNAALLAIESGPFSLPDRSAQQILMTAMKQPFFSSLRTEQQTGYIVFSSPEDWEKQLFNLFGVQSNTHDPRDLLARFELFIESFIQEMQIEISQEYYEVLRSTLLDKLRKPQNNLKDMGDLLKTLLVKYQGDFDWMAKRIETMEKLSYDEFMTISKNWMGRENPRRLGILMKGEEVRFEYSPVTSAAELHQLSSVSQRQ